MTEQTTAAPTILLTDDAALPLISAAGAKVNVNAYVAGKTYSYCLPGTRPTSPGCVNLETDLWYLSLEAPRGAGTSLRAIWANLVAHPPRSLWLEDPFQPISKGVSVMLGRHRADIKKLGWRPRYRFDTHPIGASGSLHALVDPLELTAWDPQVAQTDSRQRTLQADAATAEELAQEAISREAHPLFLLLARPADQPAQGPRSLPLALRHLLYLSQRVEWLAYPNEAALAEQMARFLWERAWDVGEVEDLYTYCAARPGQAPKLAGAFLCKPDPLKLYDALAAATRQRRFHAALRSS
ncbi:MAG TPA: hypothetical protein VFU69_00455 [Ktedonobacterales bacterium]|nr:hypothetical protein [Ktedonobacterales bacterium]